MSILSHLRRPGFQARLLAGFDHASDWITADGILLALVNPEIGNSPFNLVLREPISFSEWPETLVMNGQKRILNISDPENYAFEPLTLSLYGVIAWDPFPKWDELKWEGIPVKNLEVFKKYLNLHASSASLVHTDGSNGTGTGWKGWAGQAIQGLDKGFRDRNLELLRLSIRRLVGLGQGLTPSGDDFLAGWLLGLRFVVNEDRIVPLGNMVLEEAKDRTTTLSRAFLSAAAAGQADEHWQRLFISLVEGGRGPVENATDRVLSYGETSGADMAQGFMYGIYSTWSE